MSCQPSKNGFFDSISALSVFFRIALVLLGVVLLSGCSGGKVLVARGAEQNLSRVAILLEEEPLGARAEKVQQVRTAVEQALNTKGFAVLTNERVASVCKEKEQSRCKSADLIARFGLDAVGRLKITSLSSNNFVVGYVAVISGEIAFEDANGKIVEQVSHRESENSGVIANTGQVLGAIYSQANAFSGDSFSALATAFGRKLASQLAAPKVNQAAEQTPQITDVRVVQEENLVRICVIGSARAAVLLEGQNGTRYSLSEGDAGTYCGAFRFFPRGSVTIRINNAFGDGQQRVIMPITECPADISVRSPVNASGIALRSGSPASNSGCDGGHSTIYLSRSAAGPFTKLAVLSGSKLEGNQWLGDAAVKPKIHAAGSEAVYVVVPSPARSPVAPVVKRIE